MSPQPIPPHHPLRRVFGRLAGRALNQSSLSDNDLKSYLTELLMKFLETEQLYRLQSDDGGRFVYLIDMFEKVTALPERQRKGQYKHIGDYTLFMLGMFPESLSYGRRHIPRSYYREAGRRCYIAASHLEGDMAVTAVYRKLADKYERCELSLKWVREYSTDPFYQYLFREFGIT